MLHKSIWKIQRSYKVLQILTLISIRGWWHYPRPNVNLIMTTYVPSFLVVWHVMLGRRCDFTATKNPINCHERQTKPEQTMGTPCVNTLMYITWKSHSTGHPTVPCIQITPSQFIERNVTRCFNWLFSSTWEREDWNEVRLPLRLLLTGKKRV